MARTTYVLSKKIARGGMAEIYLGKAVGEDAFQRICAIKRILPHYAQDQEFVEMFRDEAHICKRLQHANIVQVYDFTEVEGSFALIMEHVDGADLRTLLSACESARIRLDVPSALYMAACAARGLHYAHTKVDEITNQPLGIVHRDISPQNILISFEGEVKITDFGIADAEGKITETRPGVVKGKYSYMSPEQVSAKTLDGRSDVFSLAIVLWECLAMKRLFAGQTEVETIRKVQKCEIPYTLTELNPNLDSALEKIVLKGLSKDRNKRYQTAAAFEKALQKHLNSHYPGFTSSEFGAFLKKVLAKKRGESQDDIKNALTETDLRKGRSSLPSLASAEEIVDHNPSTISTGVSLTLDGSAAKKLALDSEKNQSLAQRMRESNPRGLALGYTHNRSLKQPQKVPSPSRVSRSSRNSKAIYFVVFILLATFLYFRRGQMFDSKMHLELHAKPEVVSLTLNGRRLNNGAYTRTPLKLHLKPGRYKLTLSRPGYVSEVIQFKGGAGDTLRPQKVVLQKNKTTNLVAAKIVSPKRRLYVNVNNGLSKGRTPHLVRDLVPGMTYSISFVREAGGVKKVVKCYFKPRPVSQSGIFTVQINPTASNEKACVSIGR